MKTVEMYEIGRRGVRAEFQFEDLMLSANGEVRLVLDRDSWLDLYEMLQPHVTEGIRARERTEIEWALKKAPKS